MKISTVILFSSLLFLSISAQDSSNSSNQSEQLKTILHTDLENPLSWMNMTGVTLVFIITVLANAGGIGGGGLTIPIMMIFFQLNIKECVPIANFTGFLSAFIRFFLNFNQKHPTRPQRII